MEKIFIAIKKIIPKTAFKFFQPYYHKIMSYSANFFYGCPSDKLIVVGVTGTNGKSTTTHLIAKILEARGIKTGETSTTIFKIADKEWLNNKKMTMLGRFELQKMLSRMLKSKCKYIVIETSSEGIKQFRHLGINYDILVFTNLTPEHIEAHHGFENYKKAKLKLFKHLEKSKRKIIDNKKIQKIIVTNLDDKYCEDFLNFKVDKKIGYSLNPENKKFELVDRYLLAKNCECEKQSLSFKLKDQNFSLKLLGEFNIYNSLAGIGVGLSQNLDLDEIKNILEKIKKIPGRMEIIDEAQDFKIIVDYAPEPESLKQLYKFVNSLEINKIIHILGSCGGGRDIARRPILGKIAGKNADYVIVTNEDPYDDDPKKIIDDVSQGAVEKGKILNKNLFKILDRREAIKKAIFLAEKNDLILLTGKGSEQAICVADGKKIPWDDRKVVREELIKL
ncbi:UDP-N-acetylmuramyl-tripeptide synthetase [bacterium]|nr:UDP-N-acetylmuramyl-tripeptide synthetase [bacterium]